MNTQTHIRPTFRERYLPVGVAIVFFTVATLTAMAFQSAAVSAQSGCDGIHVAFDEDERLINNDIGTRSAVYEVNVPAGDYTAVLVSADGTHGPDFEPLPQQTEEIWLLIVNGRAVAQTVDLADDEVRNVTTADVTVTEDGSTVQAVHLSSGFSQNSIRPVSACLTLVDEPSPETTTTTTEVPTTTTTEAPAVTEAPTVTAPAPDPAPAVTPAVEPVTVPTPEPQPAPVVTAPTEPMNPDNVPMLVVTG